MEYSVQIVQERKYKPSEKLNRLYDTIEDYYCNASFLIQNYLKEIVELERNDNEKIKFKTYHIENMHIDREKFDLVIEKYIKPINPKSQLIDHSILFYVLHETFELFPNLFHMYCDENELRDLVISGGLSRDYHHHSEDSGPYVNWAVDKCLECEIVIKN